jgi:hypothetical protein
VHRSREKDFFLREMALIARSGSRSDEWLHERNNAPRFQRILSETLVLSLGCGWRSLISVHRQPCWHLRGCRAPNRLATGSRTRRSLVGLSILSHRQASYLRQ